MSANESKLAASKSPLRMKKDNHILTIIALMLLVCIIMPVSYTHLSRAGRRIRGRAFRILPRVRGWGHRRRPSAGP